MSRGVNKVILIGNIGKIETNYSADGSPITNASIATSDQWNDKATGQKQEKTEWHRVVAFKNLAEIMSKYLDKGSKVYIEGKLQTRKWQDSNGQDRYTTEIVVNDMQMLDRKTDSQGQQRQQQSQQQSAPPQNNMDNFDDDIPF